jgi:hypothetical protein
VGQGTTVHEPPPASCRIGDKNVLKIKNTPQVPNVFCILINRNKIDSQFLGLSSLIFVATYFLVMARNKKLEQTCHAYEGG